MDVRVSLEFKDGTWERVANLHVTNLPATAPNCITSGKYYICLSMAQRHLDHKVRRQTRRVIR